MWCPNILLKNQVLNEYIAPGPGLFELAGMPDSGTTSSIFKLYSHLLNLNRVGLYITSKEHTPNIESLKNIVHNNLNNIIIVIIDYDNIDILFNIIDKYDKLVNYIFIDNFAKIVLNKKKSNIHYIMRILKNKAVNQNIKITLVNQLRYQINQCNNKKSLLKPLYYEYLQPHLDARFVCKKHKFNIVVSQHKNNNTIKITNPLSTMYDIINSM